MAHRQSQVGPLHGAPGQGGDQLLIGLRGARRQHQAAGVAVEPMDDAPAAFAANPFQ